MRRLDTTIGDSGDQPRSTVNIYKIDRGSVRSPHRELFRARSFSFRFKISFLWIVSWVVQGQDHREDLLLSIFEVIIVVDRLSTAIGYIQE